MRSLIRSLVKFFPKDLALPRTGRDISGERKVIYFLLFSPNSAFFISYPLASINVRNSEFAFMCFGMGISAVFYNILYIAYMQETISSKYHGRAFSLLNSIISLTMPLGLLVAGPVFCLIGSDLKTK